MPSPTNAGLLADLCSKADSLACTAASGAFPVLLRPLAERRRVTSVEFCPLLVDAMLTTHEGGFRIFFNSRGKTASDLKRRYENEGLEHPMSPRMRFSLAHEIAHTLFYDLSEAPPRLAKQFRAGGGRTALEALERNCNRIAGHLLIPSPMLDSALRALTRIRPESLAKLAEHAGLSVEALIRRIGPSSAPLDAIHFRGCIVLTRSDAYGQTVILAVSKPKALNIARDLQLLRAGENWRLLTHAGVALEPARLPELSSVKLTFETQHAACPRGYEIAVGNVGQFGRNAYRLLTFEETDAE
jgi:IrrE N-terminal-like domain